MSDCLFCKFVNKEFETKIVYENDFVLAFNDIDPQAPIHILIIPKKHISSLNEQTNKDKLLMGELMLAVKTIAQQLNLESYRTVINTGKDAGQSVFHIHVHLMAGRPFSWPAG